MFDTSGKNIAVQYTSPTRDLVAEREGVVAWLTFSRPVRLNALSVEMWRAIPELMAQFEADEDVRVIVLKGAGDKAFIAGADISQFEDERAEAKAAKRYSRANKRAYKAISRISKPVIAMIDGFCLGGGLAIALSCDLRIASDGSKFAIPAARLGIGYPPVGMRQLLDIIGPAFAKELLLTGRQFNATEAAAMGLINRAVPHADLLTHTHEIVRHIAANAPLSLLTAKKTIDAMTASPHAYDRAEIKTLIARCFESEDYAEGRQAFLEKRAPRFRGR